MSTGLVNPEILFLHTILYPTELLESWGSTLVVAPHPDDESLGCGGAIAELRKRGKAVHVLFVSDGSMSHPGSQKYKRQHRIELREKEALLALSRLGCGPDSVTFLRLPDIKVPYPGDEGFEDNVEKVKLLIKQFKPQTMLVPWRRDPHCDHRSSWELLNAAVRDYKVHWQEYFIWTWEIAQQEDLPRPDEGRLWRLSVQDSLFQKKEAIAAHLSQTSRLIDDDPDGFILKPEMIAHFTQPFEIYLHDTSFS